MEQWIGDFDEAEKLYEKVLSSDNDMVHYLKPSIEAKIKKLSEKKKDEGKKSKPSNSQRNLVKSKQENQKMIFGMAKDKLPLLQEKKIKMNQSIKSIWKYSVIVNSKIGEMVRFELRGYPQSSRKPNLKNVFKIRQLHSVTNEVFSPLDQQIPDMVCLDVALGESKFPFYIEIDTWGTISGEAVIQEEKITLFFTNLNDFLVDLEETIWE